jgi:ketosteroid isomerase-like protein
MLLSWLASKMIGFVLARLRAGDVRPAVLLDAPDMELTFPGRNSFSGVIRRRDEHRIWLERLVAIGLQNYADEVVAVGPPWRMTVCIRGTDHARDADGKLIYENRYVLWAHLKWGRIQDYECYEDTEKANAFDRRLAARGYRAAA